MLMKWHLVFVRTWLKRCSISQPVQQYVNLLMSDNVSLAGRAFSWINAWIWKGLLIFHLLLPWKLLGLFSPQGECDCVVNFATILIQIYFLHFFQVLTTWRLYFLAPKIPAKVLLSLSSGNVQLKLFFTVPAEIFTLSTVSVTTGRIHVQLLGDSGFEFSPWTPGEFFTLVLDSVYTQSFY